MITLITFFYLFFEFKIYKQIKKYKTFIILASISSLLALIRFRNFLYSHFIFHREWTSFQYDYSLIFFYGLLPTTLAVFGVYFVLNKKFNKIFILWPAICLLNLLSCKITDFGLFILYERTMYYFLLGLVPLAAIGLFYLLTSIYSFAITTILFKDQRKLCLFLILLIIVFVNFYLVFRNYYNIENRGLILLYIIEKQDYDALKFIEKNYGKGNIILADNLISIGVYPISRNHVVNIQGSNLGYGNLGIAIRFFASACDDKQKIINQHNVDFVLSRFKINCKFLEEVYNKKDFIYKVKEWGKIQNIE